MEVFVCVITHEKRCFTIEIKRFVLILNGLVFFSYLTAKATLMLELLFLFVPHSNDNLNIVKTLKVIDFHNEFSLSRLSSSALHYFVFYVVCAVYVLFD